MNLSRLKPYLLALGGSAVLGALFGAAFALLGR